MLYLALIAAAGFAWIAFDEVRIRRDAKCFHDFIIDQQRMAEMHNRREPNCLSVNHWRGLSDREVFDRAESWLEFCESMRRCGHECRRLRDIQQVAGHYYTTASRDMADCEGE